MSLSKVSKTRPWAKASDNTWSRSEPGPRPVIQMTSCPSAFKAATTSPVTSSLASSLTMSDRKRVDPLPLQRLGGVVEGRPEVVVGQMRVVAEDLLGGPPLG